MELAKEPYFASTPCTLGSLRAAVGRQLAEALCPPATARSERSERSGATVLQSAVAQQPPRPHCGRQYLGPVAAAGHLAMPRPTTPASGWPADLTARAGVGVRGLVPWGTLFESFMTCLVEPSRNGLYQFCVVGLDANHPGNPRYLAWEPTGYFDRWFCGDEVESRLALQRSHKVYKEGELRKAVRWPDAADPYKSLVHSGNLPELDAQGLPVITAACKHRPRTSIDLMGPLLHEWKRLWLVQRGRTPKLLVLDGSGRLAMHLQDSLKHVEVVAADVKRRLEPKPLRSLWDKCRLSVDDVILKTTPPELKLPANNFDIIILPFVLHRLFDGDTDSLLALLRDALRCCSCQVLVAEDLTGETLRKWRPIVQGDWSAKILLDGVLPHGEVRDHFLSPIMDSTDRRYLVIDASKFQDRRKARESLLPATKHVSKIPP
ncbi:unnamed protein product [Durusdinium trenchii]|uniref:DNA (Cytosine-5)-methyltransferase n=2 Tax=Durusdinium trenchii TaxID=1381693 RepID=A0ABP0JJ14_9DINO